MATTSIHSAKDEPVGELASFSRQYPLCEKIAPRESSVGKEVRQAIVEMSLDALEKEARGVEAKKLH